MRQIQIIFTMLFAIGFALGLCLEAQASPPKLSGPSTARNISQDLSPSLFASNKNRFEGSGAVIDPVTKDLWVVSQSYLLKMDLQGSLLGIWPIEGDQEGLALKRVEGRDSPLLYIAIEFDEKLVAPSIREFDPDLAAYTGREWSLKNIFPYANKKHGMEGLTHIEGNRFLVSSQVDETMPIASSPVVFIELGDTGVNDVSEISRFIPIENEADVSDLYYDAENKLLYILFDDLQRVQIYLVGKKLKLLKQYNLPLEPLISGKKEEGLTAMANCKQKKLDLVIAYDDGFLYKFDSLPFNCKK